MVQEEINRLLSEGIIQLASSHNYAPPAFIIYKKTGKLRLVVDYRDLNSITIKDGFPFPNVTDELKNIPQSRIFSQIDLRQGYHQIRLSQESQPITAFVILDQHYEYLRVPFGLVNAPRVFQRIMRSILGHLPFIRIFLDDILIFSNNKDEHSSHLAKVLATLKDHNIRLNFSKSKFFQKEVTYLGHIISEKVISLDTTRINTLGKLQTPQTKKQLLRLLGFINWFRPFIKNLSLKALPLTRKTKKDAIFTWTSDDQKIVDLLLDEIKNASLQTIPDINKPFTLETDASDEAIGSVLFQENNSIGLFSKTLTKSQKNYTTTERELLAVIESLEHFRSKIYGA